MPGTRPPTESDLRLGARLFETKARFIAYCGVVALQLHTTDEPAARDAYSAFGGSLYKIPGSNTFRWRIARTDLFSMLELLKPRLSRSSLDRIEAMHEVLQAKARSVARTRASRDVAFLARELLGHLTPEELEALRRAPEQTEKEQTEKAKTRSAAQEILE
jgi:hypothetical protein